MKKIIKSILIILGVLMLLVGILIASFIYITRYKVETIDVSISPDNSYEIEFQAVGEPYWPFGASPGRLVLTEGNHKISKVNFEIRNDGGWLLIGNWKVTWFDDRVEVILSGEEQSDELWTLFFDGNIDSEQLRTKYGEEVIYKTEETEESVSNSETEVDVAQLEFELHMQRIEEGYLTVYDSLNSGEFADFAITYGAKESSSKCILYENENSVEYLVYDRESQNGKCGLYVYYRSVKEADGSWGYENAVIDNTYAYVYETGEVISSDKKSWQDVGTKAYQNATGEY